MKQYSLSVKSVCFILTLAILFSSCASSTMIRSIPENANLYIDGEPVGTTPYRHTDTKISGSSTEIRIEKEGYEPYYTEIYRLEEPAPGPIIGGFLLAPSIVGMLLFLWSVKYKSNHTFALVPASSGNPSQDLDRTLLNNTQKLRDLKKLLDEGVIDQAEFQAKKKQILEEE